jgi:hypothetical protein
MKKTSSIFLSLVSGLTFQLARAQQTADSSHANGFDSMEYEQSSDYPAYYYNQQPGYTDYYYAQQYGYQRYYYYFDYWSLFPRPYLPYYPGLYASNYPWHGHHGGPGGEGGHYYGPRGPRNYNNRGGYSNRGGTRPAGYSHANPSSRRAGFGHSGHSRGASA